MTESDPDKAIPEQSGLFAISAVDGRYRGKLDRLAPIVSEFGLMKYRTRVECEWLLALAAAPDIADCPPLSADQQAAVRNLWQHFDAAAAARIKTIERTTNHDVKAVEYFVKERLRELPGFESHMEFVHFACTSEDINNTAYGLMTADARLEVCAVLDRLIADLETLAEANADLAMLSRTHGQAASPTTLGKELRVFSTRLQRQRTQFGAVTLLGKMNGAVGNFNAHLAAYPRAPWQAISDAFLLGLGLTPNHHTTQIEPHDYLAELFHSLIRCNQVVLDFDRDVWSYISIEYFKQKKVAGETGSSTMPHKVNPIDFENAEGNIGIANALLEHLASKLQISRWQRDLSDSTALRNIGSAFAHSLLAFEATRRGLARLEVNAEAMDRDLEDSWEVLGEAVQTVMRRLGIEEPYEKLKAATRGERLSAEAYQRLLISLDLPQDARSELAALTPATYTGLATLLARSRH